MTKHWRSLLACIGLAGLFINLAIFYPGYMSPDSLMQLSQVLGIEPLTDMQPLAMVMAWKVLFFITGHVSVMLIFQLGMFWLALTLLAIYIYQEKKSVRYSLFAFGIAALPFVLTISGVIWKDNQMAFALLLGTVGTLYFKYLPNNKWRWGLLGTIVLLFSYACLVRYNALPAIIPLLLLATRQSKLFLVRWQWVMAGVVTIFIVMIYATIGSLLNVRSSHPDVFVMVDDVVNVSNEQTLQDSQLKEVILSMQSCAMEKQVLTNNYWVCATDAQREMLKTGYYSDIKSQWLRTITSRPIDYVLYKANSYALFLFPPKNVFYVWQDGIEKNDLGQSVKNKRLGGIIEIYVINFGYKYFPFLFEPWFWFAISGGLLVYLYKRKKIATYSGFLAMSAMLYLLSYIPTGATVDYRFIYWSVIASTVALLMVYIDQLKKKRKSQARRV